MPASRTRTAHRAMTSPRTSDADGARLRDAPALAADVRTARPVLPRAARRRRAGLGVGHGPGAAPARAPSPRHVRRRPDGGPRDAGLPARAGPARALQRGAPHTGARRLLR